MTSNQKDLFLPYQKTWMADRSKVKVCEKSRRVGLSWCEAADAALTAASSREAGGMDVWYVGYNKDMAQEFIRDASGWVKIYHKVAVKVEEEVFKDADGDREILTYVIRFQSGYRVTALSSRPSNLRGKQGVVVIDEAAFHDDLGGLIKAAMALTIWGGRVRIISTHNGNHSAFNELIEEIRSGKKNYSLHRITFDEAVGQGLHRRICEHGKTEWTAEAQAGWVAEIRAIYGANAAEELDCIPREGSGNWLTRVIISGCMIDAPVIRLALPDDFVNKPDTEQKAAMRLWCAVSLEGPLAALDPNLESYFGQDFGRKGDLSVIWVLQRKADMTLVTPFTVELRNVPHEAQKTILLTILRRLPRFRAGAMDATGSGNYLAEAARIAYGGTIIEETNLNIEWYRLNMPPLKAALEDRTIQIPKHADIMSDLATIAIEDGVARIPKLGGRTKGTDGGQRHADSAIALALAHYAATTMNPVTIEFQAVDLGRPAADLRGWDLDGENVPIPDADVGWGALGRSRNFDGYGL
ncbi:MAG: hypothetical protein HQL79_07540 [Magnetococcales bacterium]|nr:hypothetical protein [Magnetococcales bacterium]